MLWGGVGVRGEEWCRGEWRCLGEDRVEPGCGCARPWGSGHLERQMGWGALCCCGDGVGSTGVVGGCYLACGPFRPVMAGLRAVPTVVSRIPRASLPLRFGLWV